MDLCCCVYTDRQHFSTCTRCVNIPLLGEMATLDLPSPATGSHVAAQPVMPWSEEGDTSKAMVARSRGRLGWAPRGVWG